MIKNNDRCSGMCSNMQRISRRDFIKVAAVAGAGLVTACTPIPTEMPTGETLADSYIAYCGTSYCLACPEYKSTCAGCLAGQDEKVSDTAINCVVRTCSRERNLANCAFCEEYVCNKLEDLYAQYGGMAAARATLDEIHQSLP
jgi:hypothetical protein